LLISSTVAVSAFPPRGARATHFRFKQEDFRMLSRTFTALSLGMLSLAVLMLALAG